MLDDRTAKATPADDRDSESPPSDERSTRAPGSPAQAQQQAVAWIGQQVALQASFLAYMDVFWVLMILALVAAPLALTVRSVMLGGAAPAVH